MFGYMYAGMMVSWPLGSILQAGTWERTTNSDGESGWTFYFDSGYAFIEWSCCLALFLLLCLVWTMLVRASSTRPVRPRHLQGLPTPDPEPDALLACLQNRPGKILLDFESEKELKWGERLLSFPAGLALLPMGLGIGHFVAQAGDSNLGVGPTPQRLLLALLFASPGLAMIFRGIWSLAVLKQIDDRLLIDFSAQEIHLVDVSDPRVQARPLLGFSAIKHLHLKKRLWEDDRKFISYRLELIRESGKEPIKIFHSHQEQGSESAAELMAELFHVTLERSELLEQRSHD